MDFSELISLLGVNKNLIARIKQIFISLKNSRKKRITSFIVLGTMIIALLIIMKTYAPTDDILDNLSALSCRIVLSCLILVVFVIYVFNLSGLMESNLIIIAFQKINLTNHKNETPILISKEMAKNQIVYLFNTVGIPFETFEKKKADLENALNVSIFKMELGSNMQEVYIYAYEGKYELPDKVILPAEYMSDNNPVLHFGTNGFQDYSMNLNIYPHVLLGGSTGSGKTKLLQTLLFQCLNKGYEIIIADFKGGVDFGSYWRTRCSVLTDIQTVEIELQKLVTTLERRKQALYEAGCPNIEEYNYFNFSHMRRIVFACDEVAELLDKKGLPKETKEHLQTIEGYISTLARLGRAFGIHLFLATQRPDADVLSGQIKNNMTYKVCGRADNVLSMIVLDNTLASSEIKHNEKGVFINQDGDKFKAYILDSLS